MIAWAGFIGNFVEFILYRVDGLRLDERKRGARAFWELYWAVERLEAVSLDFLREARPVIAGDKPRLYRVPLENIAREAREASRSVVTSFQNLDRLIQIYDRTMARQKWRTLSFMEKIKFELLTNPNSVFFIEISAPSIRSMKEIVVEGSIPDNSVAQISQFNEIVERNALVLASAREHLATFIRENFSLEDVLYVQDKRGNAEL